MWFAEPEEFYTDQLAAMVRKATGNDLHIALLPEPLYYSDDERAAVNRELEETYRRYSKRSANHEPEFVDIAEQLSRPREAHYGWINDTRSGVQLGLLVADSPWFGLLAVREGPSTWVRMFRRDNIADVVVAALPETGGRSNEEPIIVWRDELDAAEQEEVGSPAPSRAVRRVRQLAELQPWIICEFYAETRDRDERRGSRWPLRIYDNDEGRWTMIVQRVNGQERITLAPAGAPEIASLLTGMRRELETAS